MGPLKWSDVWLLQEPRSVYPQPLVGMPRFLGVEPGAPRKTSDSALWRDRLHETWQDPLREHFDHMGILGGPLLMSFLLKLVPLV